MGLFLEYIDLLIDWLTDWLIDWLCKWLNDIAVYDKNGSFIQFLANSGINLS